MHAGSPSAAASPATQATSVSWTSAGSTVEMEAPALPPPLVCPTQSGGRGAPCPQPQLLHCLFPQPHPMPGSPARAPSPSDVLCFPPRSSQLCSSALGLGGPQATVPLTPSLPRHAHLPVPHRLHRSQMHPAGVCGLLCQQQHLHCQPRQPAPMPMPARLPGRSMPVP